jgi:hypothetical protein
MKKYNVIKSLGAMLTMIFLSVVAWAQEKKVDVNIETTSTTHTWYTQPWVWIVGGAVFILLLVALVRGNSTTKE